MAHIMDMANGTIHPVEEPSYQVKRDSRIESRDATRPAEYPQLQLAMVEAETYVETRALPAASIDALIRTLED